MRMSIRSFLLINLLLGELFTIIIVISVLLFWSYRDSLNNVDMQLLKNAFLLQNSISFSEIVTDLDSIEDPFVAVSNETDFSNRFDQKTFQSQRVRFIDSDGNFLLNAGNIVPYLLLDQKPGFTTVHFDQQAWRAFSTRDPNTKLKVVVLQQKDSYHIFSENTASKIILVVLVSYPLLAILIWFILNRGLSALRRISAQLKNRSVGRFSHIDCKNLPSEIKPIVREWNKLFDRLKLAFEREQRFAGDAAHELKTPLAALKTHTQIALHAKTRSELVNALKKIVAGVNRSAHVVQQLLILNRISQGLATETPSPVDMVKHAREVIAELFPGALEKKIEIELIAPDVAPILQGYGVAISILVRNLVDNAIRYCPEGSLVQVTVAESEDKKSVILTVADNGHGIPRDMQQRVFERFFRVIGNKGSGSGLGLGIVSQIVALHSATITLGTPCNSRGLKVTVTIPKMRSFSDTDKKK